MPTQPIPTLKETFSDGKEPNGNDFSNLIDSFYHKNIPIPIDKILGLIIALAQKADKKELDALAKVVDAKADKEVVDALANGIIKQDAVNTYSELATKYPNPQIGWDVLVLDENTRYSWNGTKWADLKTGVYDKDVVTKKSLSTEKVTFEPQTELSNIESGDSLSDAFGKLQIWYANLFSSKYIYEVVENGFYICDDAGNCVFGIDANGKINFANGSISSFTEIAENGFAIADRQGNSAFRIDKKGNTEFKISKKFAAQLKEMLENPQSDLSDINHIITYGQSLGEGSQCSPIITSSSFAGNALMFNHGIKTRYATDPKYQSFVPHVEQQDAENGETPAAGTAEKFIIDYELDDASVLSSCCARGAMTVAQLSKGTAWYNNMIADVTNAKRLADTEGKTYRLMAVTWTQGEYDYGNGIEYYKGKLKQLRADFIADIEAITGDDYSDLPFITYQVSSSYTAGKSYPDIGLALLELGLEAGNGFYMATPIYHLQYADGWHLRNTSSKWLGAYYGHVLNEVVSGNEWQPLHPISHTVNGNVLLLKFNKGSLTFEKPQYLTATIQNRGFSLKNGAGNEIIQSVELSSDDTVKITCSESPNGLKINYGFSNINNRNAGELRDSSDATMTISGSVFNLYNWCSVFEYNL